MSNIKFSYEKMFSLFNEMLNVMEFKAIFYKEENKFGLIDIQGGNLGDIESDRFDTIADIIARLDVYIEDYYINDLCDQLDIDYDGESLSNLIEIATNLDVNKENQYSIDTLQMIVDSEKCEPFNDINGVVNSIDLIVEEYNENEA